MNQLKEFLESSEEKKKKIKYKSFIVKKNYKNTLVNESLKFSKLKKEKVLRICIINDGINDGLGDYSLCIKFVNYLHNWFKNKILITVYCNDITKYNNLLKKSNKFKKYKLFEYNRNKKYNTYYDGFFITPLVKYWVSFNMTIKPFKYANHYNTFSISEYNVGDKKIIPSIDLMTGVGANHLGLMFENFNKIPNLPTSMHLNKDSFILMYININDEKRDVKLCVNGFLSMINAKYKQKTNLQIVLNLPLLPIVLKSLKLMKSLKQTFGAVYFSLPQNPIANPDKLEGLVFRFDILPQPNLLFLSLMKYSLPEICLTGDQSITDCLSCCIEKKIFYQTMPWKSDFAKALAKNLPNHFLKSYKTSCGSIQAIHYKANNQIFKKENNFDVKAKPVFSTILNYLNIFS